MTTPALSVLTNSVPFDFDCGTIAQLRSTMKKLLLTSSQVYHRVACLTGSPKETTTTTAAGSANVEEAATVSNDNLFCKPVSSGMNHRWSCSITYHKSQKSRACHRKLFSHKKQHYRRNPAF
jgi:hypothetical protein